MSTTNSDTEYEYELSDFSDLDETDTLMYNFIKNDEANINHDNIYENNFDGDNIDEIKVDERKPVEIPKHELELHQRTLSVAEKAFIGNSSSMAVTRIMKDRKEMSRSLDYAENFEIDFENDNIHIWNVVMRFPKKEKLQQDLNAYAEISETHTNGIKMEITFPSNFPMAPPFMRVVSPRFKFHTGRVTIGGSICTELLTSQGWLPTYSVGQALIQVQSEILGGNPDLEPYNKSQTEYSRNEALEAFMRVARQKGWEK